jgi:hypothetical protein
MVLSGFIRAHVLAIRTHSIPGKSLFQTCPGPNLGGEAGVWIYGESEEPDIDVGQGTVSGEIGKENVRLTLRRGDKILGTLTLTPKGKPVHRTVGFDLLLSPTFTEKLELRFPYTRLPRNFCRLKCFGRSTIAERTQDLFRSNRNAETTRQ